MLDATFLALQIRWFLNNESSVSPWCELASRFARQFGDVFHIGQSLP
jgi:hypothetical protein